MKLYLFAIITLVLTQIQDTTISYFNIDTDKNIYYQKVFLVENEINTDTIEVFLSSKSNIYDVKKSDSTITFNIQKMKINYQKYGGSFMNTLVLLNQSMSASGTIDVKKSKYRLTLKNIQFLDDSSLYAEGVNNQASNTSTLESYVLKNRKPEFRTSNIITTGLNYMDLYFSDFFKYQLTESKDW